METKYYFSSQRMNKARTHKRGRIARQHALIAIQRLKEKRAKPLSSLYPAYILYQLLDTV